MGGIAGAWGLDDPSMIEPMLERLRHRGPDSSGLHYSAEDQVGLGNTRLSVIDVEGGDQPISDRSGGVLVADGEIFNAASLRESLGADQFSTRSDSETILALFAQEGLGALARLQGMYAFALSSGGEVVLGRDPIGIKPLYVGKHGECTVFASELKALPAHTHSVEPLEPGTLLSSRTGSHRYFEIPDPEPVAGDLESHARRIRRALERAVRSQLTADVPVGAFLSGGLDSSAIVALMRPHIEELHTFSVGLSGSPDLAAASVVAGHLGTIHHEYVMEPGEILEELPAIVYALESYDQDLVRSAVPTHFAARLAARHVKVALTGEGADELFAGYTYHKDIADLADLDHDIRRSLGEVHHLNLQRVDRLTMAQSLEARVPFLDVGFITDALAVPVELRSPAVATGEKAVLRAAVTDLLPPEIVRRDKTQFDEGTGAADLLPELMAAAASHIDIDAYRRSYPDTPLRSAEECRYHELVVSTFEDPELVLANVGRWVQRN